MQLTFLGSGSAFTVGADNFQSNMLLTTAGGRRLLIDCGSDIRFSLYSVGLSYFDITDIYISHLHSDHVGGLEYIGFTRKYDPRCECPHLYLSKELTSELWERTLSGGMRSLEGDIATLDSFFAVHPVERGGGFAWEGVEFQLVRVVHVNNGFFLMPSYGLFFEIDGTKIFLTTDAQNQYGRYQEYYRRADTIFQDAETAMRPTGIHAHYNDLRHLPADLKRKMWLYHYQPGPLPDARADGFRGFVKRGQVFDFSLATISAHKPVR
ncbi:metal-dependent hydrolase of the beta-lactamase superfamily III [Rubidibacter lacunae KORDI 51-2]|uniref:Metal-dependent hydrolase of the beta-lactamase superfamily III n=1 Tax=Rubidibacter lacunae KORDI 51-2 TaxID=582515 RepID=U5DQT1_9CHRO|nr:MBL fold metallo-hydrolase [Rubidibacter lacunae]ERN42979.1 metal-dependent hydrolase of the beta-lactamase superfamily III [Rubidibacter lacunae KORDI 51-2]